MANKIRHMEGEIHLRRTSICLNIPKIPEYEKSRLFNEYKKRGMYNGSLMALHRSRHENDISILEYGKSSFFNFVLLKESGQQVDPILCSNAILLSNNRYLLIKRDGNVYSCPNYWDFPAGMAKYSEASLKTTLINRIYDDTKIPGNAVSISGRHPASVLFESSSLNFFYNVSYEGKLENLDAHLKSSCEKGSYCLLKKEDIPVFIKNNKVVFPEILLTFA